MYAVMLLETQITKQMCRLIFYTEKFVEQNFDFLFLIRNFVWWCEVTANFKCGNSCALFDHFNRRFFYFFLEHVEEWGSPDFCQNGLKI
jgi:hypothetical protein